MLIFVTSLLILHALFVIREKFQNNIKNSSAKMPLSSFPRPSPPMPGPFLVIHTQSPSLPTIPSTFQEPVILSFPHLSHKTKTHPKTPLCTCRHMRRLQIIPRKKVEYSRNNFCYILFCLKPSACSHNNFANLCLRSFFLFALKAFRLLLFFRLNFCTEACLWRTSQVSKMPIQVI